MAEAQRQMAATDPKVIFAGKYGGVDKIWSGKSFIQYHDYKTILAELPVSQVAVPTGEYSRRFAGNLDYVYGEMLYSLTGYEGYLRDKALHLQECFIRPILRAGTFILQFNLRYQPKEGGEALQSAEVIRLGNTRYLYFIDYYRPM
jgi:hypothetical protein